MRKIFILVFILYLSVLPAKAEFSALERGSTAGRIIYGVAENSYLAKSGQAITENDISALSSQDYGKTGLSADGNSRLILRYKSSEPGTVEFSVSPSISGSRLESFTDDGNIKALKEGSTTIIATAYGKSPTVNFIVKPSASESDTTKDITVEGGASSSNSGCNAVAGLGILM